MSGWNKFLVSLTCCVALAGYVSNGFGQNVVPALAQAAKGKAAADPRVPAQASRDLFAAKTWKPPAPPPPPPAPPPKPVAPPFPYVFAGSMRDAVNANDVTLFLSQGNRNFIVRKGGTLGTAYRLDDITESEATFTYLPLQEKQRLAIGNNR